MTPTPAAAKREWGPPHFDVCGLLSKEDIQTVLQVSISETKAVGGADGPILISQCFYMTAPATPIVTLAVTSNKPGYSAEKSIREHWKEMFSPDAEREKEERVEKSLERESEKKEHPKFPPRQVEGLGQQAYWAQGTLFILNDDSVIRLSLGGTDDEEARLAKAKTLGQKGTATSLALPVKNERFCEAQNHRGENNISRIFRRIILPLKTELPYRKIFPPTQLIP